MKCIHAAAIIVLIILLGVITNPSAAQSESKSTEAADQNTPQQTKPSATVKTTEPAEPNAGPGSTLKQLESEEEEEQREWSSADFERKPRLMRAVNKKLQAELKMLREIALEEGAEKTVAVIDDLIEKNNQRYEKAAAELEDEERQARLEQKREERQQKLEEKRQKREERRQQRQRDREDRNGRRSSRRSDDEY